MACDQKPLHNKIFETLRDRIVYGEYPPGTVLPEKDLCEEFGVSRTPLREAILKLEDMALVTVIPRYGTSVAAVDMNEMRCAFELKKELEGLVGQLAAKRIKPEALDQLDGVIEEATRLQKEEGKERHFRLLEIEAHFHKILWNATENPILQEFLENLHYRCGRLWSLSLSEAIPDQDMIDQMRKVSLALKEGNSNAARERMESHVRYFVDKIKMQLL
jgi:DNA-binding GntR family transcriptional regulator